MYMLCNCIYHKVKWQCRPLFVTLHIFLVRCCQPFFPGAGVWISLLSFCCWIFIRRLCKASDVGKFFFKSAAQVNESNFEERVSSCGNFWEWLTVCRTSGAFDAVVLDLFDKCSLQILFCTDLLESRRKVHLEFGTVDESHSDVILSGLKIRF